MEREKPEEKKKIIHLENIDEAKAFMKFLEMEKRRHIRDIQKICDDQYILVSKWGLPLPLLDEDRWVEV